jgi:hypothetical protein
MEDAGMMSGGMMDGMTALIWLWAVLPLLVLVLVLMVAAPVWLVRTARGPAGADADTARRDLDLRYAWVRSTATTACNPERTWKGATDEQGHSPPWPGQAGPAYQHQGQRQANRQGPTTPRRPTRRPARRRTPVGPLLAVGLAAVGWWPGSPCAAVPARTRGGRRSAATCTPSR